MVKPVKNRIMCPDCGKPKMFFKTEKEALSFIKWNSDEIENGEQLRPYYCPSCCGYHISHKKHSRSFDYRTINMINDYHRGLTSQDRSFQKKANKKSIIFTLQEKIDEIMPFIKIDNIKSFISIKYYLKDFFSDWWKTHEQYDGWEDVDKAVRDLVIKNFKSSKRKN